MKPNKITPYLPYKLLSACIQVKQFGLDRPLVKEVNYMAVTGFIEDDTAYKIILRPLNKIGDKIRSNYTKEAFNPMYKIANILGVNINNTSTPITNNERVILSDDNNYIHFDLNTKEIVHKRNNRNISISQEKILNIREFLYETHFDINGLIASNEAYDLVELSEKFNLGIH